VARVFVFADEAGNFDFSRRQGASRYFILTTVTAQDCSVGDELSGLRRQLSWEGTSVDSGFHATTDPWPVRNRVFTALSGHALRIDATILEKSKAEPKLVASEVRFYQYAWYLHFKFLAPQIAHGGDELHVFAASIETSKKRGAFDGAVQDVVQQVTPTVHYRTAFWPSSSDPCLQAADYACWAVQRSWEQGDPSVLAKVPSVRSQFDVFRRGTTHYY